MGYQTKHQWTWQKQIQQIYKTIKNTRKSRLEKTEIPLKKILKLGNKVSWKVKLNLL